MSLLIYKHFINWTTRHISTHIIILLTAVEKGSKNAQPLYISYYQTNGRKTNIYFAPGDHPYLGNRICNNLFDFVLKTFQLEEETNPVEKEDAFSFFFNSFVTPDRKEYTIESTWVKDNEFKQSIRLRKYISLKRINCTNLTIFFTNSWASQRADRSISWRLFNDNNSERRWLGIYLSFYMEWR